MAKSKRLTERQLQAIEFLSMPARGGLEYKDIAEKVGVSERSLYTWRQQEEFNDALKKRTIQRSSEYLPDIMASIPGHIIEGGNAAMLRTYMQAIGALTDKVEVEAKNGSESDKETLRKEIEEYRKRIESSADKDE